MTQKIVIFTKIIYFCITNYFLSTNEKKYIQFNKKQWNKKNKTNPSAEIILVDLFYWFPLIHFWSIVLNIFSKQKLQIKSFYFPLDNNYFLNKILFTKLSKIFLSFGCTYGPNIYNINFKKNKEKYRKLYFKKIKNINDLSNFKRKNILFGDLIYDTYIRKNFIPHIKKEDINNNELLTLFIHTNILFDYLDNYFSKNKIKYIFPSHVLYVEYGLISRIGDYHGSKIIKTSSVAWATSNFEIHKCEKGKIIGDFPYHKYKSDFKKISENKKKKFLLKGKKIINSRFHGVIDKSIIYMKKSSFKKNYDNKLRKDFIKSYKKRICLFSHCLFDGVHRFGNVVFDDYYNFIYETCCFIKNKKDTILLIKPHPNGLIQNDKFFFDLKNQFSQYKNIIFLNKNFSNLEIFKHINLGLTVHGTVAYELAYKKIPVITAGENPYSNYNFCLKPKSKKEFFKMILELKKYRKKINYSKSKIYEYLYMHYNYYNLNKNTNDNLFYPINKISNKNKFNFGYNDKLLLHYIANFKNTLDACKKDILSSKNL